MVIGPLLRVALLNRHGTLDALYAALPSVPARQAELLRTHQERVHLNRRLVTIVIAVDVATDLEAYRWATTEQWTAGKLLATVGLR